MPTAQEALAGQRVAVERDMARAGPGPGAQVGDERRDGRGEALRGVAVARQCGVGRLRERALLAGGAMALFGSLEQPNARRESCIYKVLNKIYL